MDSPKKALPRAAHEIAIEISFKRMSVAPMVQVYVGVDHILGDPGSRLTGPRNSGARSDNGGEIGVDADFEFIRFDEALKAFGSPKTSWVENHSWIRGEPKDGLVVRVPGEDAPHVGFQ